MHAPAKALSLLEASFVGSGFMGFDPGPLSTAGSKMETGMVPQVPAVPPAMLIGHGLISTGGTVPWWEPGVSGRQLACAWPAWTPPQPPQPCPSTYTGFRFSPGHLLCPLGLGLEFPDTMATLTPLPHGLCGTRTHASR